MFTITLNNSELDLGGTLEAYASFAEMGRLSPGSEYGTLFGLIERDGDELSEAETAQVAYEAAQFLAEFSAGLSENTLGILRQLADSAPAFVEKAFSEADVIRDRKGKFSKKPDAGDKAAKKITRRYRDARKWKKSLSDDEFDALDDWMGGSYSDIRRAQRLGLKRGDDAKTLFHMKTALARAPRVSGTFYRGMSLPVKMMERFQKGKYWHQTLMTSYSKSKSVAQDFASPQNDSHASVTFEVKAKKVVPLGVIDNYEKEVLFDKPKMFKILSIKIKKSRWEDEAPKYHIRMREVTK